jgi:hypothetical protein
MVEKLNEILDKIQVRLLRLDQLRQRVLETLDAEETDDETLELLSSEVQRRLAKAAKPKARKALQKIADRIYRHRLMRAAQLEEDMIRRLNEISHRRRHDDDDFGPRISGGAECMCSVPDNSAAHLSDDHQRRLVGEEDAQETE